MQVLLDSANLEKIKHAIDHYPIQGVTTNPSILALEHPKDVFAHLNLIRALIGPNRSLHVQVIGISTEEILNDAKTILDRIDKEVYVKIPATPEGLKAIRILKSKGIKVTATAVYSKLQSHLSALSGADYIAPYVNRMANLDIDPYESLSSMVNFITNEGYSSKIVAASFKNLSQVNSSIDCGIHALTIAPDLLEEIFAFPSLSKAVSDFNNDFKRVYGEVTQLSDLKSNNQ
jgi:TalC/MipB family fructose-6-phosphate aldolase